ncbi:MAG TPA: hypothetical protein VHH34_14810, partial [Pseudonocardiaceae bacterium]|nr:hypothetical protein [Pseudonocardiaceae bacterium]
PGVGKTRLAREALARADPRRYVRLWTAGTAAACPAPLGAFAALLPEDLRTGPATRLRDVTRTLLDRAGTPRLLLGVDDAHLLDETSAALVHQFARTRRAFVLVCLRTRHSVPDPIRALWKDGLALRAEIRAPGPAGTAEVLVAALGGQLDRITARRLYQATQGNLHFLRELVEAGLGSGALTETAGMWCWNGPWVATSRLVEVISAQIGHLEPTEREVLEIVAFGEPIGADVLTSLAERRTVEALESRNLLLGRQEHRRVDVRLAHPLYGEVLRAGCPPQRAAAVRCALADAVEATGARRRDDWLRIVTWRLDAHAPLRPELLVVAACRAVETLDLKLAERLARTAAQLGAAQGAPDQLPDQAPDGSPADAVLGRVLFLSHRHAETEQLLARLADTPMPAGRRAANAVLRICNLFCGLQRIDEAFAVLRATRDGGSEGSTDDPILRDELDLLECVLHLLRANLPQALHGLAELQARPQLSPPTAAGLSVVHGMVLVHRGSLVRAREVLDHLEVPDESSWVGAMP